MHRFVLARHRRVLATLILSIMWLNVSPLISPSSATTAKIAFTHNSCPSNTTNKSCDEIYTMSADGTGQVAVTATQANSTPAMSADGGKIAFTHNSCPNNTTNKSCDEIYTMNASGTNKVALTTSQGNSLPVWSPDGTKLAYTHNSCPNNATNKICDEIFVMSSSGTNQIALTTSQANSAPAWSPNGTKIAYTHNSCPNNVTSMDCDEIYTMNADGSGQTAITTSHANSGPAWSPDSAKISYTHNSCPNNSNPKRCDEVYVMNANGTNQVALTTTEGNSTPSWAPDATKVLFTHNSCPVNTTNKNCDEVYAMNPDGSGPARLTTSAANSDPSWPLGTGVGNLAPTISFNLSTLVGVHRITSISSDLSGTTDPNGDTITFSTNWGDGTTTTGSVTSHVYTTPGTFQATATTCDTWSACTSSTKTVTVTNSAPTVAISATPENGTLATSFKVTFPGTSDPETDPISFKVQWGDGTTSTQSPFLHTYSTLGDYEVLATATDSYGAAASDAAIFQVCSTITASDCDQNGASSAESSTCTSSDNCFAPDSSYTPDPQDGDNAPPMPATQIVPVAPNGVPSSLAQNCDDGFTPDGIALCVFKPNVATTTALTGRVIDEHSYAPISGAVVTFTTSSGPLTAISDLDGQFGFVDLPIGGDGETRGTLEVSKTGYGVYRVTNEMLDGGTGYGASVLMSTSDHIEDLAVKTDTAMPLSGNDNMQTAGSDLNCPGSTAQFDDCRVPPIITVKPYVECGSTARANQTVPWKYYVLKTVGGETRGEFSQLSGFRKKIRYLRAMASVVSNYGWFHRLDGEGTQSNPIDGNSNRQCYRPDIPVAEWWPKSADNARQNADAAFMMRAVYHDKTADRYRIKETFHRSASSVTTCSPPYTVDGVYVYGQHMATYCANQKDWHWQKLVAKFFPKKFVYRKAHAPDIDSKDATPGDNSGDVKITWDGTGIWFSRVYRCHTDVGNQICDELVFKGGFTGGNDNGHIERTTVDKNRPSGSTQTYQVVVVDPAGQTKSATFSGTAK